MKTKGCLFKIQSFSVHDGPGIRDTVFMKGCNLHCYWCHNPESWSLLPELQFFSHKCIECEECIAVCPHVIDGHTAKFTKGCKMCGACVETCYAEALLKVGYEISSEELTERLEKNKLVFEQSGGGVTFSGGEPLLQPEFLLETLRLCKEKDLHTALETAACVSYLTLKKILPYVDFIFCDIKCINEEAHIKATGVSNKVILENIKKMSEENVNLHLRTPIIPGFNDTIEDMEEIADFIMKLPNTNTIELLPFHGMCEGKYESLDRDFKAKGLKDVEKWQLEVLSKPFREKNIKVIT